MASTFSVFNPPAIDFPIENVIANSVLIIKVNQQMPIHGTINISGILIIEGALVIRS